MGPFAQKGDQWVCYDDPAMAASKARFIVDNQLGGAMFWDLASEDFRDKFGGGTFPIIRAVANVLYHKVSYVGAEQIGIANENIEPQHSGFLNPSATLTVKSKQVTQSNESKEIKEGKLCDFSICNKTFWPEHMEATLKVTFPVDVSAYTLKVEFTKPVNKFVVSSKGS